MNEELLKDMDNRPFHYYGPVLVVTVSGYILWIKGEFSDIDFALTLFVAVFTGIVCISCYFNKIKVGEDVNAR